MTAHHRCTLRLSSIEDLIGYNLRRASNVMIRDFFESLADCDLSPAQYSTLLLIGENPGRTQTEIGTALGVKRTNFIPLLEGLQTRTLVRRQPSVEDRRSYALSLTDQGVALLAAANARVADHEARFSGRLSDAERTLLLVLLKRLWANPNAGDEATGDIR